MKNKITAISLAALMILVVFAAFVTPVSAAAGGRYNDVNLVTQTTASALIGQELNITANATSGSVTIVGKTDTATAGQSFSASVSADGTAKFATSVMTVVGEYTMTGPNADTCTLGVSEPTLSIDLKIGTTSVSSTTAGTNLTLKVTTNIADADVATIELKDPDGNKLGTVKNATGGDTTLKNLAMSTIKDFGLNTTGFQAGTYTVQVKTNSTVAQGLTKDSNIKELTIVSPDITISASKTSVVKGEKTTISLTAPASDTVYLTTTPTGKATVVLNYNDIGATFTGTNDNVSITMKSDSTFKLTMTFNDTGTYTLKASDINTGKSASVDIS
ncbi:MAG: hypothetical protein QMC78_06155, partial [Methanocellales archaeon]|nr:hypothetical protein [Methanocellales archaeon]